MGWGVAVLKTPSPVATEIFAQAAGPDWSGFTMTADGEAVHLVRRTLPRGRTYSPGPRPKTGWTDLPEAIRQAIRSPKNLSRLATGSRIKGFPNVQTVDISELELPVLKSAFKQVTGNILKTKDDDEAREALTEALAEKNMGLFFDDDGDLAIEPLKPVKKAKTKEPEPEEETEEEIEEEKPAPKAKAKAKTKEPEPEENEEEIEEEETKPAKKSAKAPAKVEKAAKEPKKGAPKKGEKPDFTPRIKKDATLELLDDAESKPREGSILGDAYSALEDGMTYGDALEAINTTFKGAEKKPNAGGIISNLVRRGCVKVAE
jgi:hypothetical protein